REAWWKAQAETSIHLLFVLGLRRGGRLRLVRHHGHRCPVTQAQLPIQDYCLAGAHAASNFDLARTPQTELDLRERRLAVGHAVDEAVLALGYERLLWHDQRVFTGFEHQRDAGKHSRLQSRARIGD